MQLNAQLPLTTLAIALGLNDWETLVHYIKHLPYGRNTNRYDFSLVLKEQQGSCSSKHALLKAIALENNFTDVKLVLAMFKMNSKNTPQLKDILKTNGIDFIPEAHCYLKIKDSFIDVTNSKSDYSKIENDILETQYIQPEHVVDFKVNYHKQYVRNWLIVTNSDYAFNDFWKVREACISKLSE